MMKWVMEEQMSYIHDNIITDWGALDHGCTCAYQSTCNCYTVSVHVPQARHCITVACMYQSLQNLVATS